MSDNYYACVDEIEKSLTKFCYSNGRDLMEAFTRFLEFVVDGFDATFRTLDRNYTSEETKYFTELLQLWLTSIQTKLHMYGWFDALGELYERLAGRMKKQNSGQFFTPCHICDLMAQINAPKDVEVVGKNISDPSAGSGRNLLAFNALHPGNFMVAEDIDRICCLMCVCNFLVHGIDGEVVWHDSLDPSSYNQGWRVNKLLNLIGLPTVLPLCKEESMIYMSSLNILHNKREADTPSVPEIKAAPRQKVYQMSLFD